MRILIIGHSKTFAESIVNYFIRLLWLSGITFLVAAFDNSFPIKNHKHLEFSVIARSELRFWRVLIGLIADRYSLTASVVVIGTVSRCPAQYLDTTSNVLMKGYDLRLQ